MQNRLLDIITPRFVTEKVAVIEKDGQYIPLCSVKDLRPDDKYDHVITLQSFNLFGFGLFPRHVPENNQ